MFPNVNGKLTGSQVRTRFAKHIRGAKHFHTEASQLPLAPVVSGMQIAHDSGVRDFSTWTSRPAISRPRNSEVRTSC